MDGEADVMALEPACDILIVEDDLTQSEELAEYLTRCGYSVQRASTASEGCHRASLANPRIALVDYNLPDFDGAMVADRIRRLSEHTAVVLMSGRIDGIPDALLQQLGLFAFVNKPVALPEVRRIIGRAVGNMTRTDGASSNVLGPAVH
jgi:DNA-binding response OmpR family regulator